MVDSELKITEEPIADFLLGTADKISLAQQHQLVELCVDGDNMRRGGVVSRQGITRDRIEGIGRVVVKHYIRGGLLHFVMGRSYVNYGEYRSRIEYRMLRMVRALGVSAPQPIAYVIKGKFLYHTWLILAELEGVVALADLAAESDSEAFERAVYALTDQVERLIEHRVFHIDLHPGNVMVNAEGEIFILDFDKAKMFTGSCNDLRDRYLHRWRRAVIKHNLPESFSEIFCARLRKRFEECLTQENHAI